MTLPKTISQKPHLSSAAKSTGAIRRVLTVVLVICLLGLIGFLWSTYERQKAENAMDIVPVIAADPTPYKTEPTEPGGMDIPHQDSAVFNALRPENEKDTHITPQKADDEAPIEIGRVFAGMKTDIKEEELSDPAVVESLFPDMPEKADVQEVNLSEEENPSITPQAQHNEQEDTQEAETQNGGATLEKSQKQEVESVSPQPQAVVSQGTHYVQLASVQQGSGDREREYVKLKSKYAPLLDEIGVRYQAFSHPEKGDFWRIQVGSLAKEAAQTLCDNIKAKNGGCFVVAK